MKAMHLCFAYHELIEKLLGKLVYFDFCLSRREKKKKE